MIPWSKLALVTALACVVAPMGSAQQPETRPLQPFTGVQVCTPYNVLIQPNTGANANAYQLVVDADQAVRTALKATVTNGVLALESSGAFQTSNPIKVTVRLPATKLEGVTVTSPVGINVVVASGFSGPAFTLTNNGATALQALGYAATQATVLNQGTGAVLLKGQIAKASVNNQGTGTVYVSGATQAVDVNVGGVGNVVLDNANNNVAITGTAQGLAYVQYNRGQCSVQSQFGNFFGGPCRQGVVNLPPTNAQWSCGLNVNGVFTCSGSSGSVSSGGGSTTVNSGGNTVTSVNGNGNTVTSVGGGPGQFQSISVNTGPATAGAFAGGSASGGSVQTSTSTGGTGFTVSSSNGNTVFSTGAGGGQVASGQCNQLLLQNLLMVPNQ